MDTIRFILIVSLSLVLLLLWDAWQRDYGQQPESQTISAPTADKKEESAADLPAMPADMQQKPAHESTKPRDESGSVHVVTDLFDIKIDTHGGTIEEADLLEFPTSIDRPHDPVRLLTDSEELVYIIQGGLLSSSSAPTHDATYIPESNYYRLEDGQETLRVPLLWHGDNGVEVRKIYEFTRNKYQVRILYEIKNNSSGSWKGRAYGQIQRTGGAKRKTGMAYTYTGAVLSSPEKRYEKISFDDIKEKNIARDVKGGWAAMIKHYFVTALVPSSPEALYHYYSLFLDSKKTGLHQDRYVIGATSDQLSLDAGENGQLEYRLYIGPKVQSRMEHVANGLDLTVDYGFLWFIAKPLFWCLQKFHALTGNWGWAIILVTLMLKVLFYNLSAAGYRSMAKMRKVQPRLLALRERYKNDRAKLNKAMMDMYKQEKINPLGGCFPILVQIP
ncbi:MAG TPA: membrane protein insertase YidC, partial [Gammaproteobacteria bacterium]|nr:membrane protein insertase YidC [Gammaproteobacteria bacterium]